MKKQMRDIPETLQDNMGQKMRLTVNGAAVKSPCQATVYNTAVPDNTLCESLCTYFQNARPLMYT